VVVPSMCATHLSNYWEKHAYEQNTSM